MIRLTVLCTVLAVVGYVNSIPLEGIAGPRSSHSRIVNGEKIDIKEAPFMAMLVVGNKHLSYVNCGGTIMDSRHILTAAHCIGYKLESSRGVDHARLAPCTGDLSEKGN